MVWVGTFIPTFARHHSKWAQTCAADTSVCQIVVVDHPTAGRLGLLESEFDIATKMQSRQSAPVSSNSGFRDAYGPSSSGSNGLTDIVSSNTGFGDAYGSSSSGSNGLTDMLATMQASMQQNHVLGSALNPQVDVRQSHTTIRPLITCDLARADVVS